MSAILSKIKKEILINPILKSDKNDIELIKVLIKNNPEIGLDINTLFKSCKLCKQKTNDDITRYFIAFNKEVVNFNNISTIIRFIIADYSGIDKSFTIIILL